MGTGFVARAHASPVVLDWATPDGCPPSAEVAAAIHRLADPGAAGSASVRAAREGAGWRATVTTTSAGASAQRELHAPTCRELANAVAVVIAVDVAPVATAPVAETESPAPAEAPPAAAAPLSAPPPQHTDPPARDAALPMPRSRVSRWAFGGRAVGTSHPGFGTTMGAAAHAAFTPGAWRLELEGAYYPPGELQRSPSSTVRQELLTVASSGCFTPRFGRLSAGGCAGIEAGRSRSGFGAYAPVEDTRGWAAVRAGALVTWEVTPLLALRADLGAAMAMTDDRIFVDGERLHPEGALLGRVGLGLELHFR